MTTKYQDENGVTVHGGRRGNESESVAAARHAYVAAAYKPVHDDKVDAAPSHLVPLETPAAPFWRETWFWEQVVYVLLFLGPAMAASWISLAAKGPLSARDIVLLAGTALSQLVAQKARSAAARQVALAKRAKVVPPEIRCAPKVKRWTQAGQVLGAFLSVATSPTWWHVPSVLWALFLYDAWRAHREARKQGVAIGSYK